LEMMGQTLTRADDRALFGLDSKEDQTPVQTPATIE